MNCTSGLGLLFTLTNLVFNGLTVAIVHFYFICVFLVYNRLLNLQCATNADCSRQVNEENLVVECFSRVPISKV